LDLATTCAGECSKGNDRGGRFGTDHDHDHALYFIQGICVSVVPFGTLRNGCVLAGIDAIIETLALRMSEDSRNQALDVLQALM